MKYDAIAIYCNENRQPEPLLVEPEECESIEEFMDFLYALIESVVEDPSADDVLHAISTHAWTTEEIEDQTLVQLYIA